MTSLGTDQRDLACQRKRMTGSLQYGEFRNGYGRDKADTRLVFHGIRYLVENYLSRHALAKTEHLQLQQMNVCERKP